VNPTFGPKWGIRLPRRKSTSAEDPEPENRAPRSPPKHRATFRYRAAVARTKQPPKSAEDRRVVGGLLRELRKAAGYRSVDAAAVVADAPSSRQTIYAYERGGLTPSLAQFLDLVEFYVLRAPHPDGAKAQDDLRAQGVAAVTRVLTLPLYHVAAAQDLVARMQPGVRRKR
jgi:DNA-binding XRE family transcriptional regulator